MQIEVNKEAEILIQEHIETINNEFPFRGDEFKRNAAIVCAIIKVKGKIKIFNGAEIIVQQEGKKHITPDELRYSLNKQLIYLESQLKK